MSDFKPLAETLRPKRIEEVIGQSHLLGLGKPLTIAFQHKKPYSIIFWGPPGVGKTTLARLLADAFDCEWIALSAVLAGVKEIREAISLAESNRLLGRHTLIFIDEIHRFNKSQQDALLPHTESGLITFIGATTENPSFEVNKALLSRAVVYTLKALSTKELKQLYDSVIQNHLTKLKLETDAIDYICHWADGDARRFLNALSQIMNSQSTSAITSVSLEHTKQLLQQQSSRFDKGGEDFYNQISALHKSVRGSNPDAALYWLCRMLKSGVDVSYLSRRIIRMAWEDIGLADPKAIEIANLAATTYERLGSPEGDLALGEAVIYLAVAAKSNAAYNAFNQAMKFIENDMSREVPMHLRNAPTTFMKSEGYGKHYRYAHDEPHAYAAGENYFPEHFPNIHWYQPVQRGLEIKIGEKLAFLKDLDLKSRQ